MAKNQQLSLLKKQPLAYGGELLKKRKARMRGRPIDTRNSMHLVLRSSQAVGDKSFKKTQNANKIQVIVDRFARKNGVKILSLANVGNHLHFHLRIAHRRGYYSFIRAITGAIAMAIGQRSRWVKTNGKKFWDYRPFTRVIVGWRSWLGIRDYLQINQLEGLSVSRPQARWMIRKDHPRLC